MNRAERRRTATGAARKPQPNRRNLFLFGTVGIVAVLVVVGVIFGSRVPQTASEAPTLAHLTIGQTAPSFSVASTGGPLSVPTADKKPVVLEVFATWCPHCQKEVTVLNKLFAQYGKQVHIVGVSGNPTGMDGKTPESAADVVAFTQKFKTQYPIAYDPELKVMNEYLQGGYPTIVIIGGDNKIRAIHDGEIAESTLVSDINSALKG